MNAGSIAGGAPTWVYVLLAALIALGVRRLKPREVPVVVALIPVVAFATWSIVGVASLATQIGALVAVGAWLGGVGIGSASAILLPEARGRRKAKSRVLLPGTVIPLISYMLVFAGRFACGTWAAIHPADAALANATGTAIGAAMTARLVVSVLQWQPEPIPTDTLAL